MPDQVNHRAFAGSIDRAARESATHGFRICRPDEYRFIFRPKSSAPSL